MSKKVLSQGGNNGWKYRCQCGYETVDVASAVGHINHNKDHRLTRIEL